MRGIVILAAAMALGLAPIALAAEPITRRQVLSGNPSRTGDQIMNQVADLMTAKRTGAGKPTQPLRYQSIETQPRSMPRTGICRIDQLRVEFEPTGAAGKGSEQPVLASGFTAQSYFKVLTRPTKPYDDYPQNDGLRASADPCAGLDLWEDEFFAADDEREALGGHRLYRQMLAALPGGDVKPICDLSGTGNPEMACERFLATFTPQQMMACLSDLPELKGTWCRSYSSPGVEVRIFGVFPQGFGKDAREIRRVDVSTYDVDFHPVAD